MRPRSGARAGAAVPRPGRVLGLVDWVVLGRFSINLNVMAMNDLPAVGFFHQDMRYPILCSWNHFPTWRGELAVRDRRHSRGVAVTERSRLDGVKLHPIILEDGIKKRGVCFQNRFAAAPVHTDNVDPLGILTEQLGEGFHVVCVQCLHRAADDLTNRCVVFL